MLYNMNFISFHRNYRSGSQKYSSLQEVQKEIFEDSIQDLVGKQHENIKHEFNEEKFLKPN